MRWRRHLSARTFHALWIAAVLLLLMIWFDFVWLGVLILFGLGLAAILIDWLVSIWSPTSRRWPKADD